MRSNRFSNFAWFVLYFCLPVIGWASFVRLSFSGDGCGSSWPDCGGSLIPTGLVSAERMIEFIHRMTSGIFGILAMILLVGGWIRYAKAPKDEKSAFAWPFYATAVGVLLTGVEFLIGKWLVNNGLVGWNASIERAQVLSYHLVNTLLLVSSFALAALWTSGVRKPRLKGQGAVGWLVALGFVAIALICVSGAVTSLGDKLFPPESTPKAITDAMDPGKHFLIQLRVLHPFIALTVGVYLVLVVGLVSHLRRNSQALRLGRAILSGYGLQIGLGILNIFLKAPNWLAVVHLLVSVLIWIGWTNWSAISLAEDVEISEKKNTETEDLGKPGIKDYIVLTKPKVISLLLFTTITALFASAGGQPGWGLFFAVFVGGYMAAGAANAINMVIDRDIDGSMKRTATRPTVTNKIAPANALFFGCVLAMISFGLLWFAANLLTALLAFAGLAFYVVIYTLLLKRRTWQNIVIGGAAGSFPPLVGWAAFRGELDPLAWLLFAIIFVWTPVHFWALALMIKDEYAKVNVPMLPVVKGERATTVQIALYGVITALVSTLPYFVHVQNGPEVRNLYLVGALLLNALLLVRCYQLLMCPDRPHALRLYKYSMVYLALLFLVFAIDCAIPKGSRASLQTSSRGSLIKNAQLQNVLSCQDEQAGAVCS
jgi:protoheme IX farnesyltransferase